MHHRAKLTDAQVAEIRQDGRTQREVAKSYGVSESTISNIRTSLTRVKHITPDELANLSPTAAYQRGYRDAIDEMTREMQRVIRSLPWSRAARQE